MLLVTKKINDATQSNKNKSTFRKIPPCKCIIINNIDDTKTDKIKLYFFLPLIIVEKIEYQNINSSPTGPRIPIPIQSVISNESFPPYRLI